MTKVDLAEEAGVSRHTVAAIERGEGFTRSSLTKIMRALDAVEVEQGKDAPPPGPLPDDLITVEVQLKDGRIARVIAKSSAQPDRIVADVVARMERLERERDQ